MRGKLQIHKQNKTTIFKLIKTSKHKSDTKRYRECTFSVPLFYVWQIRDIIVDYLFEASVGI